MAFPGGTGSPSTRWASSTLVATLRPCAVVDHIGPGAGDGVHAPTHLIGTNEVPDPFHDERVLLHRDGWCRNRGVDGSRSFKSGPSPPTRSARNRAIGLSLFFIPPGDARMGGVDTGGACLKRNSDVRLNDTSDPEPVSWECRRTIFQKNFYRIIYPCNCSLSIYHEKK